MSWFDVNSLLVLEDHQRQQLKRAVQTNLGIFTGAPGTGKTYTLGAIIRNLLSSEGASSIAVCAPTGKAAVRATQSLLSHDCNITANTIHRTLGVVQTSDPYGRLGWSFIHNSSNPLPYKYIFIDEASWLGNSLGASLFSAIHHGTKVLLIGDHHQLPPVEKGAVLRDLIAAGIPHGDLTEIHRNSGQIVIACKKIREGQWYEPSQEAYFGDPVNNLRHIEQATDVGILSAIESIVSGITQHEDINPLWDVQFMTYQNSKGKLCRNALNLYLQERLNQHGTYVAGQFRTGDKIICLSNGFYEGRMLSADQPSTGKVFVANGEMGELLPLTGTDCDKPGKHFAKFDDKLLYVTAKDLMDSFDLGYAITVHKSQGSSFPVAVMVVDPHPAARMMGSRQMIYTGLSRAEKYCVTIGTKEHINREIAKNAIHYRRTRLAELVHGRIENDDQLKQRLQAV